MLSFHVHFYQSPFTYIYISLGLFVVSELCSLHKDFSLESGHYCVKPYKIEKSFEEAEQICAKDGAHIFHTKTAEDADFLNTLMFEKGMIMMNVTWCWLENITDDSISTTTYLIRLKLY